MRSKLKLILTAALVSALAVAGLSVAAGGGNGGGGGTSSSADTSGASVADRGANRGARFHRDFADEDVRAVLEDVREAVAKQAPAIAGPVIDKAEQDGKITGAQADALRKAAQDIADGERPDLGSLERDADVHEVIRDAFAAAAKKAPEIGEPIIKKAVDDDKITEAQADRIREMLKRAPRGPGFGKRHGRGFGGGPPAAFRDADSRAVLEDVREAVAKQAPAIAGPVIDKAEQDGKITGSQADALRKAAQDIADGERPNLRSLKVDADVHEVLRDVFAAVAEKTPGIAKPIIDKAVDDGEITEAQGRSLNRFLSRAGRGPHLGPGPGHHSPGMGGRKPQGFGMGGPPPDMPSGAPEAPAAPSTAS